MKTRSKILSGLAVVALLGAGAFGLNSLNAQTPDGGGDDKKTKKVEKRIEITEENGERNMTVTTTTDGVSTSETFTGAEIDAYMAQEHAAMEGDDGSRIVIKMMEGDENGTKTFDFDLDFPDDMKEMLKDFELDLEGLSELNEAELQAKIEEMLKELNIEGGEVKMKIIEGEDGENIFIHDGNGQEKIIIKKEGEGSENIFIEHGDGEHGEKIIIKKMGEDGEAGEGAMEINVEVDDNGTTKTVIVQKSFTSTSTSADLTKEELKDLKIDGNNALEVNDFKFYPNPSDGKFNVAFELPNEGKTEVSVTDLQGKQVFKKIVNGKGPQTLAIDLTNESKGVYILNLKQGKQSKHKRLVIE